MDVFTAIRERRSCRAFLPGPVSEEAIEKILQAAVWAPSPMNAQPWEFIVITNQELRAKSIRKLKIAGNQLLRRVVGNGWSAIKLTLSYRVLQSLL